MAEIVSARAALLAAMLCSHLVHAAAVKIPEGQPMGPNPVAAQGKPTEKHAAFAGVERSWYEYVPAAYSGKDAVPLVVAIHGGNSDAIWMFNATSWAQIADQVGFIVVYPNGSIGKENKLRWNGYSEFNTDPRMAMSSDNGVDEAKFLKELIEKVESEYKVDPTRVYMHGQSNGGMMTSYFGLRYPEVLAAMGVASAPPSIEVMSKYPIHAKLPTYFWSGETDTVAGQYNPADKSRTALCKEFAEFWARINTSDPEPKLRLDGLYNTNIYSGEAEVRSTEFRNGVHTLPFTTAYLMWNDFFSRYARGKDGEPMHIKSESDQAAPPDKGAVAIKLQTPFALVDGRVVRIGETPEEEPILVPGAPSSGVLIPAAFAAVAFEGVFKYIGETELQITTPRGTAKFTVGSSKLLFNGKETMTDVPAAKVNGRLMISLRALAGVVFDKTISTRHDVYRNDIYYVSDRPADVSAQTIAYIDKRLSGGR